MSTKKLGKGKICYSYWCKASGLMFKFKILKPLVFVFDKPKIVSLHMWFVFTPIDVLFCNYDLKVLEIKKNFLPFSFYNPKNKSSYVIELPKKTISDKKIKVGDFVTFERIEK